MQEKKGEIQVQSTQLSMLLGQQLFILVNSNEYENLKKENQYLKGRVAELEHNADMFRQQIETDKLLIDELRRDNENLRRKIESLEIKIADQDIKISDQNIKISDQNTRIKNLENRDCVNYRT